MADGKENEKDDPEHKPTLAQDCLSLLNFQYTDEGSEDDPEYNPDDEQPEEETEEEDEEELEMKEDARQQLSLLHADNDIEMSKQTAIPNARRKHIYRTRQNSYSYGVTPSDLADIAAATAAGVPILKEDDQEEADDENDASPSSCTSSNDDTEREEEDDDDDEDDSNDDNEHPDLNLLCLPLPFNVLLDRYLREGLFYNSNHRANAVELLSDLEEFRRKYQSDKAKYTLAKWEMWYASYWPKSSNNNDHNTDELTNDLVCLEAFRYELHDISNELTNGGADARQIDCLRMQYLANYGILCIEKMQEHYRYIVSRNICLSWSVVVWLTSTVDFCARYIHLNTLSAVCVALLKSALTCYDYMLNAIGRNHDACKLAKKLIDNACKLEYELLKQRRTRLHPRPRIDTFIVYVLSRARWRHLDCDFDIFEKLKRMMNALNQGSNNDNNGDDDTALALPFPWDTAHHLTNFLYVCEKCALYYSEFVHMRKWILQIIDTFYHNILNFPTQHIRVLNDVDPMIYSHSQQSNGNYVPNSLTHIMNLFNKIISAIHEESVIDYDYTGQEFDVVHDGHRMIDISFLSVYMKQIGNSNVEIQLRGLTKIDEIMRKIQERCTRRSCSMRYEDHDSNNSNDTYKHKWLSEPRLAQYLTVKGFMNILFERDSHNKILERSQSIIEFLAQEEQINRNDLQMIWKRCQQKHESQTDAYYKIIKTLALSLDEANVRYLLQIITGTPQQEWETDYVHLIYTITRFAAQTRYKHDPTTTPGSYTYWFGLQHLWNMSFASGSPHALQAQRYVVELLSLPCFASQIENYLMQCVRFIRNQHVTVDVLRLFKTISIAHIGQHTIGWPLLKSIAKQNDLLNIIFNELRNTYAITYASAGVDGLQSMISIQAQLINTSQSLQQQLLFIDFLLRFGDAQMSQHQVKELWQMLVCNPCLGSTLKAHALDFFCNAIDPQAQKLHFVDTNQIHTSTIPLCHAAFTDEIAHYVGKHLCNTLDAKLMTIKHFNLSKAYFYHLGVSDGIFRLSGARYYLIDAKRLDIDWLWNIVFDAADCTVSTAAQLLLQDVYTLIDNNNNINISSLYEGFVDKCMTCAQANTSTENTNANGIQQALNVLLLNENRMSQQQMNRIKLKRCFSLLRMAIDHFGGKRHGNTMNIQLIFVEISSKTDKLKNDGTRDRMMIEMGELQTCRELGTRVQKEVRKQCPKDKTFKIKGLIKNGKRIDETNSTLSDEFTFEPNQITVVYTVYDIAAEEKTNANPQPQPQPEAKPNVNVLCGPETPGSTPTTEDTAAVTVDVEAMSQDPVIMEQQKQLESSIRSNSSCNNSINLDQRESGLSPPAPPPPPSAINHVTTPRPSRKQPCFGPAEKPTKMKQLTLTAMYKKTETKKSDYNDFTTGGLTRVDSMVSIDMETTTEALHPSDILSKSKYFNQLFSFLTHSHDIACEAWDILRKLPLNQDKKLCVKDFNDGWNHMFDLQQHDSVLMARYGLDILRKLTMNDARMYQERSNNKDTEMIDCVDNGVITQRWTIQFIRKHGLVLVLKLLIAININKSEYNCNSISCASMVIHFLADILQIDNEPTSIANEILSDEETSQLFLSPQVLSSIMSIIGVLSSFTESVSIASQNVMLNPMKFSTQVLKLCFVVLKFILENDDSPSHQLIEYFLSSNLRQWIHRLLIRSPYPQLRSMVQSQLQLLYQDHFTMGQDCTKYDKIKHHSQDPRLLVGVVKACLEILAILPVTDSQHNASLSFELNDRFHCHEFMDFLHDAIAHLVTSFDVLSKQPQYKVLLIENCSSYDGINWYHVLDKFMSYFMSYHVTESQQTRPDDTKLLPLKANLYSTFVNSSNLTDDTTNHEYYADKCLIGVMNIISKLIQTLSNINLNINDKLISFIECVFHRGLFPDIDTIWKQRRDPFQLPLCKQKKTRQSCMALLVNIATCCDTRILCRIQEMMTTHHSAQNRLRKYLNFDYEDDWNYVHNILSRPFNGNVGLVNLGATCYMNSLMQQLFSNQQFRFSVLSRDVGAIRQRHTDEKQKLIQQKRDELRSQKTNMDLRLTEEKDGEEYKDCDIWKMIVDNNSNKNNKMIVIGDKDDENCAMLNELQNIFTYLQESDLRSYDPLTFCTAYKQPGGRAMELRVQMDVDEFFAVFTDKLEKQLQFDSHCNIIQYLFGGVFATQMIGRKGCKHYREKSDPFVTLTLDVKSKKDIMNSLNSYVQGEVISDYQCDKCNKRIEILKRSCIRILPRNLVIHLKRFDFDIETLGRAKVNDALQFPPYLDMTPFTKDGLENKEHKKYIVDDNDLTEEEKKDRQMNEKKFNQTYDFESSNMYRLVGIINHSGGTESGHYTSYIRQCNTTNNNPELNHKWSYFNDRIVEQWDCKKIPDECFGGSYTNTSNTNNNNTPSNKMYSAYMLFYERVSMDQRETIEHKMQNGALSKSYYNLTDVLMNHINNNHRNAQQNKVSGRKRQQSECSEEFEPPHKKQKLSNGQIQIRESKACMRREDLIDTEPKAIPKYVLSEEQSDILDPEKRERVWNENKAAMIERQVLEKQYMDTCIQTVMLSAAKDDTFVASKLALTLLFESIGHCKSLNQIVSRTQRNNMCKILGKTALGCKWFVRKLLQTQDNHWFRTLYDPKLNRIYGETMGDIVRDLVITALKCLRREEHKHYGEVEDDDMDLDIDTSSHCIVALIRLMLSRFHLMDKADYSHPIFEILMHFAHFGNEERVLLIDLGMIWKGIAYYKKDFTGLETGVPSKNSENKNNSSSSSSEVKIGWKRKTLKEVATFRALPQIISTLITSIHPEYLETFFHAQHYSDVKKQEKAVSEDWLNSKCLLPSAEEEEVKEEDEANNLPPKLESKSPFPNDNYARFAIAPNVQKECRLSSNDYIWLKNKDVLEYLLEYGTVSHLNEVMMSHLAHSSNILYKRIIAKITESFNTAFSATLKHLFDVIKLILGVALPTQYTLTTMPELDLRTRCLNKIYPKLFSCATTQEAKYHRDAQALMEMAQELTTSTEYSFAYALACHDTMIELIIRNLFDKNKKIVSHIAALILTHLINTNAEIHAAIIAQIMAALSTALSIASDQSLIDNSNESFPDDLKYVERKAKVNKYFAVVTLLMQLHPTVVIPQLTAPDNWSILCETVAALESGADTFSWAKNDDKLMVMQIIIDCIDKYTVDPQQLFHMKLVDALTSQYLVSTRSTVVSQHMTQVVSITYRLLRHFAFDNETGAAWIGAKIVNQHWFLWAISDIVTPHNVYQSSIAAHSILVFIEKMMSLDAVQFECTQMIEKCVKKWDQMPHSKKLNQYPRDTILQLLMLILRTEADHVQFLRHLHGRKLISQWINNFFLCNVLGDKEAIATYNIAFDFFNFYLAQIAAFGALQTELGTQVVSLFIDAICSVFAYDSCRKTDEWKEILKRGLQTLQRIFDLEKSLENVHIMKHFFHKLSQSEILMFSSNPKDYVRSKNTTDSEEMVMQYLSSIRHPPNGIAAQIGTKCAFVESKKHMYCYQMSALLEIFVANYAQFDWNDDHFDVETQGCIAAVMISAWFLLQVGCALPDVIVHHMSQYFAAAAEHVPFKYHPVCWVSFVVLMTSDAFQPQMLRDPLNMKLCLSLTKATLDSVLDVAQDNSDSKLLKDVKTKTLLKYLPVRFELCCDQIIANKDASSLLFIEYYHHAIQYNSIIVSAKPKFWTSLRRKMDLIMSGSNDEKIIEYLREIAMIIDNKIQKSRENPPPDVVMANEKNKVIKTKTVNKKSKKALPLQIKFNQNKTTTKPPPPPPPPPAPQQNDAPQTMAVDTKKDDDEDK